MKVKLNEERVFNTRKLKKGDETNVDRATGFRWIRQGTATRVKEEYAEPVDNDAKQENATSKKKEGSS